MLVWRPTIEGGRNAEIEAIADPDSLRELEVDSAIAPELVAERGYRSVTAAEARGLGFATYQCRDGTLIPLHDLLGSTSCYALKPNQPRLERRDDKPDRPIKYEHPAGQPPVLDVPLRCQAAIADPDTPLLFTEGAKKADCAAGFPDRWCVINIWGVHNWYRNPERGGFATIEPIADWDAITPTLDGRVCYLAFDSDGFTKDSVALALRRLANFLARRGALVFIVHLPDADDGSKQGLDDYVAAHGREAFLDLVDQAEPWGSIGMVKRLQAEIRELRAQLSAQAELLRNPSMRERDKGGSHRHHQRGRLAQVDGHAHSVRRQPRAHRRRGRPQARRGRAVAHAPVERRRLVHQAGHAHLERARRSAFRDQPGAAPGRRRDRPDPPRGALRA
jgi:Domain of unknown function (DUF3854)